MADSSVMFQLSGGQRNPKQIKGYYYKESSLHQTHYKAISTKSLTVYYMRTSKQKKVMSFQEN